jgi:hypothetical protein
VVVHITELGEELQPLAMRCRPCSPAHHLLARIMRRAGRSEPLVSSRAPRASAQEIHEGEGGCPAAVTILHAREGSTFHR